MLPDADRIHAIIQPYADEGLLLPRTLAELRENVKDFVVVERDSMIAGCGALHLYGMHLAEIRSIAVAQAYRREGMGRMLVNALMKEARRHSVACVCLFTRVPDFFARLGFEIARREDLPDKIYKDCVRCPKLHCCDEIAMVKGEIPPNINDLRDPRIPIPTILGSNRQSGLADQFR